jgi:hypothetical protein
MRLTRLLLLLVFVSPLSACADPERILASAAKSWCRSSSNCTVYENR